MGFFSGITHAITNTVKSVAKVVTNPAKLTTAVLTGGLSVVAPKLTKPLTTAVQSTLFNPALATKALGLVAGGGLPTGLLPSLPKIGAPNMGINFSGLLSGATTAITSLLGGGTPGGTSGFQTSFQQYGLGQGTPFGGPVLQQPQVYQTASSTPQIIAAGTRAVAVGRGFFNKFPNLATAIQGYRNMGKNITRAKLYSLMKRFGPDLLISGGILSAAAVSELMMAGPGRRRMNPGNVKALRRSLRRLDSFDKLCHRVMKHTRHRKTGRKSSSSATFVRQG